MKLKKLLLSPIIRMRKKYYKRFVKTESFYRLVENDKKRALDIMWYIYYGRFVPWEAPRTLNEKIMWLSVFGDTSLWQKCTDKYEVRSYLEEKGLGKYLNTIYGIWDSADEIPYSKLPNSFVVKCTHDCGSAHVVRNKEMDLDVQKLNQALKKHLEVRFGYETCEPHYINIKPRVIAEALLEQGETSFSKTMIDYKFFCINGKALYCLVCYDRPLEGEEGKTMKEIYDVRPWRPNHKVMSTDYLIQKFKIEVPKPENYDEMVRVAETISKGFPVVRVDLYNLQGTIIFGEMTFTGAGGRMTCFSNEAQMELGAMINL